MELWICLAGLKPTRKCKRFGNGKGAYVHIAAWADSRGAFEERVRRAAEELDCSLVDFDDVQPFEERIDSLDYSEELSEMRVTAMDNPNDAVFGKFHIWLQDEAN
jgi:hypothetical protein